MNDRIEIKGGAGEFEAAVVAVVLNQLAEDEKSAVAGRKVRSRGLSAWVRALTVRDDPQMPRDVVWPD